MRRRKRRQRRQRPIAGNDGARHDRNRAGLGREPQPPFLHHVPYETVLARLAGRAHVCRHRYA